MWEIFKGWFCSDEIVVNCIIVLFVYILNWKGFYVGDVGKEMEVIEVIVKLDKVVDCMINVWIKYFYFNFGKERLLDFKVFMVKC